MSIDISFYRANVKPDYEVMFKGGDGLPQTEDDKHIETLERLSHSRALWPLVDILLLTVYEGKAGYSYRYFGPEEHKLLTLAVEVEIKRLTHNGEDDIYYRLLEPLKTFQTELAAMSATVHEHTVAVIWG